MDTNMILTVVLGVLAFIGLKKIFEKPVPPTRSVDPELQEAYIKLQRSGPELAEKKRKYEEALRNIKSSTSTDTTYQS